MKTVKLFAAFAAASLLFFSCGKEKNESPKDTTPAELKSFTLLAEDNDGLEVDYAVQSIAPEMVLRIPGGGIGKTLKATLTAGENDVIKVNDVDIADGKVSFNATFPVDVVVTNSKSGLVSSYVVKVGKILNLVCSELPTYTETPDASHSLSSFVAANPVDGNLYLAYERQLMVESTDSEKPGLVLEKYKNVSVVKWNGAAYEIVGNSGIADNSSRATNIAEFDFDADGNAYVIHYGEKTANTPGVKKFDGTSWSILGPQEFEDKINTTFGEATFYMDGGKPSFIVMSRTNIYHSAIFSFDGTAWNCKNDIPGTPAYDAAAKKDQFWRAVSLTDGDQTYIVSAYNQHGLYMHSVKNNTFTPLVSEFKPEGQEYVLPNMTLRKGVDGKLYLLASILEPAAMQVFRYNEQAKIFETYTEPLTGYTIGGTLNSIQQPTTFFILPTGQFVVIRIKDEYPEYCMLDENRKWTEWTKASTKKHYSQCDAAMSKDGTILMAYISRGDDKVNRIESSIIKLEDDVLPE